MTSILNWTAARGPRGQLCPDLRTTSVARRLLPTAWAVLVAVALVVAADAAWAEPVAGERPNVVLIVADDLGYGDLGCYGHPRFRTPHLDRLAKEGVRLTQFNTPAPFCAPTRASLLTGRYPARCRLTANPTPDGNPLADGLHLPESERLLPELLREAGYATAMIGKWHLGHRRQEWWPARRGFDSYLGILYSNDMRPVELIENLQRVEYPVVQATLTQRYTQRALSVIEEWRERPFFLYLAHAMPHKPLACSEKYYHQSGNGLYGDVIEELDASVGAVLAKLAELKLEERTLVIFTSDNGAYYGGSSGPLRGMKGTAWEGGYRVPCLARWSGRLPAGRESDVLGVTMDLFATVLAATGVAAPAGVTLDGRDLLPVWHGEAHSAHEYILGQNRGRLAVIRDQRFKLHMLPQAPAPLASARSGPARPDPRAPDGVTLLAPYDQAPREVYPGLRSGDETTALTLFDLQADPGEQHNVAAEHPEEVARLRGLFEKAVQELGDDAAAAGR